MNEEEDGKFIIEFDGKKHEIDINEEGAKMIFISDEKDNKTSKKTEIKVIVAKVFKTEFSYTLKIV